MRTRLGKKLKAAYGKLEAGRAYPLDEAINLVKGNAAAKFDETMEIAVKLGIDPKHSDQAVRGVVSLPHGTGKKMRVAVFARDDKAEEAKAAGADVVGAEELAEDITSGKTKIDFDRVIATPDMMAVVGKLGKELGPKGLMPNPKLGTVAADVTQAVKDAKGGQIQFRSDAGGVVHGGIGKVSFGGAQLGENAKRFLQAISQARPSTAKGVFIRKISVASTMGAGVMVDAGTIHAGGQSGGQAGGQSNGQASGQAKADAPAAVGGEE